MSHRNDHAAATRHAAAALVVGTVAGLALAPAGGAALADPVAVLLGAAASGTVAGLWYASRRRRGRILDGLFRAWRVARWELHCHLAHRRSRRLAQPLSGAGRRLVFAAAMIAGLLAGLSITAAMATPPQVLFGDAAEPEHAYLDPPGGYDPGPIHRLARWLGAYSG